MCRSMVDIHSATAEIRRGKKKKKKIETTGQKYNVRICYAGRPINSTRTTKWIEQNWKMVTSFLEQRLPAETQLTEAMTIDDLCLLYIVASSAHTGANDWQNSHLHSACEWIIHEPTAKMSQYVDTSHRFYTSTLHKCLVHAINDGNEGTNQIFV